MLETGGPVQQVHLCSVWALDFQIVNVVSPARFFLKGPPVATSFNILRSETGLCSAQRR